MNAPIHIPDSEIHLLAALLLLNASPVMLANRLAALFSKARRFSPLSVYFVLLVCLLICDMLALHPGLPSFGWFSLVSIPVTGVLAAGSGLLLDLGITTLLKRYQQPAQPRWYAGKGSIQRLLPGLGVDFAEHDPSGWSITRKMLARGEFHVPLVVGAGMLEEAVYRWALPTCILLVFTGSSLLVAMLLSGLFYGLIHLSFGPVNILSKTLVGYLFAGAVILSGSIFAAMLAHGLFNLVAMRVTNMRRLAIISAQGKEGR